MRLLKIAFEDAFEEQSSKDYPLSKNSLKHVQLISSELISKNFLAFKEEYVPEDTFQEVSVFEDGNSDDGYMGHRALDFNSLSEYERNRKDLITYFFDSLKINQSYEIYNVYDGISTEGTHGYFLRPDGVKGYSFDLKTTAWKFLTPRKSHKTKSIYSFLSKVRLSLESLSKYESFNYYGEKAFKDHIELLKAYGGKYGFEVVTEF